MFRFKQFNISQEITPMKIGTDGVLLGAWAEVSGAASVLDIGTGTGVIAIMAAQRNPQARIDALEIEPSACLEAAENMVSCPWHDRLSLYRTALQDYRPERLYDCIISNPPYFTSSTKAPDKGRTLARHNDSLSLHDLLEHASRLLSPRGSLSVILPVAEARSLVAEAVEFGLGLRHLTHVIPNPGKPDRRHLLQLQANPAEFIEDELVIEISRHNYTPEYIRLTEEFYL